MMAKTKKGEQLEIGDTLRIKTPLMGMAVTDDLRPHPNNYVEHPEDQIEHLKASLVNFGFYRNIVVANENYILAGHGIWTAAKALGMEHVPIVKVDMDPFSEPALKLLIGDNEVRHLVVTDDRGLADMMIDITKDGGSLEGTGWDQMMLANFAMVTRHKDEILDLSHAKHWVGMPNFERVFRPLTMTVHVRSEEDRMKVLELLGLQGTKITKRMVLWWPPAAVQSSMSLKFVPEENIQENPEGPSPLEVSMMDETDDHEIEVYGGLGTDEVEVPDMQGVGGLAGVLARDKGLLPEQDPAPPEPEPARDDTPAIEENPAPEVEEPDEPEGSVDQLREALSVQSSDNQYYENDQDPFPMTISVEKNWTFGKDGDGDGAVGTPMIGEDTVLTPDDEIGQPNLFDSTPADRYTS